MKRSWLLVLLLALSAAVEQASAQAGVANRPGAIRRQLQQQQRDEADPPVGQPAERRLLLEQQIRRTLWRVAKQRIGFTDEQMTRLERTSERFDQRRRLLAQQERVVRVGLRREILADSLANQTSIASALDQLYALQQQRHDLQGEEQKEFSAFMSPLQRARFLALQEQVRKRLQEVMRARPDTATALRGP